MQHLYPAQKIKVVSSVKYPVLFSLLFFAVLFSFSQSVSANPSTGIVSFSAQLNGPDKVMLSLVSGSEKNTSHFIIQRSTDKTDFEDIALIFSEEENINDIPRYYFYSDKLNNSSAVLYRVKTIGLNGVCTFSDTIAVDVQRVQSSISAQMNPQQNELRITIPQNWSGKTVYYNIYDTNEKIVKQAVKNSATRTETLNIADLPTGRYTIKAINGKDSSEQKIVKLSSYS